MSGFDTAWLDLREPADHAARAPALLCAVAGYLDRRPRPLIVDLGCGTGSTLRALGPHLSAPVRWRLVDHDAQLLAAAAERHSDADVAIAARDLRDLHALPLENTDLVTASALFDLVSAAWLTGLAARLRDHGAALYAALSYDGQIEFAVPHPADGAVVEAFNRHQRGDKGFGPALGPTSGEALETILAAEGFAVTAADSPWRLEPGALQHAFVAGLAEAVQETGLVSGAELAAWRDFRLSPEGMGECTVGHRDLLALPPG